MQYKVQIVYKPVKTISLKVKPTLEVILTVPLDIKQDEIDKVLKKRHDWILAQLNYFKKFQQSTKDLVSGESFTYLGRNYRLKISSATNESVKLIGGYLHVNLRDKSNHDRKKQLIETWYKQKAEDYFKKLIAKYTKIVKHEVAKVSIRKMKTRWGSCNPKKSYINLNLDLIKKHAFAIEYVIFHELVHLIHYNHDKGFYNFLATHMPDWQIRRERLYN
ncbi:MAG: M48 family peptidase [Neisseriales bacterium]|nr:MAG: M48 family peptidase [Neisseriales bacterium]